MSRTPDPPPTATRGPARRSLATRLVAGAGVWCAFVLAVGGLLLAEVFHASVEASFDARLAVILDSLIAVATQDAESRLRLRRPLADPRFERAYSGWYWQITTPQGERLRSRSLWDAELASWPPGSATPFSALGPDGEALRVTAAEVRLPGEAQSFEFLVAGATEEIVEATRRLNRLLAASLALLGAGLLIALVGQIRFGLSPLRAVSRSLAAIRSGQHARLEGDFPVEIQPLARELNALLEQNARVTERARTHVGNLAHALKTPLSVLRNAAADLPPGASDTVERQIELMRARVEHYLARARTAGPVGSGLARTPVLPVARDLVRTLARLHPEREITLEHAGAPPPAFAGDREDLEELLGNVLDNACKWGKRRVTMTLGASSRPLTTGAGRSRAVLEIVVDDDGDGLDAGARAAVMKRGARLDETIPGSGLGLDIVRDITALYGGSIALEDGPAGGLRVRLCLPALGE